MKKKSVKRELQRFRRDQRQLWRHMAEVELAVLRLLEGEVYEPDDDDSDEVEVPKLKVVGDG